MRHRLTICATCCAPDTAPKGQAFAAELQAAFAASPDSDIRDVEISTVDCMSVCAEPLALSFRAPGKWAYLFSGVDVAKDAADVLAFARLYLDSGDGEITDARPCGRLRFCLRGRIPA